MHQGGVKKRMLFADCKQGKKVLLCLKACVLFRLADKIVAQLIYVF